MVNSSPIRLLLVDDDEVDRMAVQRGLERAGVDVELHVAVDGLEALETLRGDLRKPFLVLLDLNMPRLDGMSMLRELRQDEGLRRSVVFVLSTSDSEEEQRMAYDLQAAGYIVKSRAGRDVESLARLLRSYWDIVALPLD